MESANMFLTTEAVAKILRVTERTIQNYRSEGKLKFYKISPKVIRYRVEDVVEFLHDNSCCFYQREKAIELIKKYLV